MPRTETTHRCSICHKGYGLLEQAEACEMKGEPDASKFPIGLIYETLRAGTDEKDGGGVLIAIKTPKQNGHVMELECYSAADVEDGLIDSVNGLSPMDTLDGTCYTYFEGRRTLSPNTAVRRGTLRLARMVQHLRSEGIEPLIWDGKQAERISG